MSESREPPESNDRREGLEARERILRARMAAAQAAGRAAGDSPAQLEARMRAIAKEEMRGQAPKVIAAASAWWKALKRLVIFGVLAIAASAALALSVEHLHAKPLCARYGSEKGWRYDRLDYPYAGRGSGQHGVHATCRFVNAAGRQERISLERLEPNFFVDLGATFSLLVEFTVPLFFILFALAASPFLTPLRPKA